MRFMDQLCDRKFLVQARLGRVLFNTSRMALLPLTLLMVLAAVTNCPRLVAQDATGQETLTNADVVKMVQAHLGVDVIVQQIRNNHGNYSLTTNSLILLKQKGVPDRVIASMQAKIGGSPASPSARSSAEASPANACGASGGKWEIREKGDQLTGGGQAVLCEPFHNGRDRATVTASCGGDLFLQVVYNSPDKDLIFKVYQPDPTIFMGQIYSHQQRVSINFAIDGKIYTASPTTEYLNEATLTFIPKDDSAKMKSYWAKNPLTPYLGGVEPPDRESLYHAKVVRIDLPLNDGETPVVEFNPQDPSFKQFAARCPGSDVHVGSSYTADEFASMVPGILREAAVKHGLAADAYDKEIEFATNVVKTCAQIQPWMAEDSSSDPAGPKKDVYSIARTYGQQYMICQKLDSAKHMYFTGSGVDGVAHLAEDISMSSNQQTGPPSWVHPGHPDVGLGIYQSADHLWSEGKGFYLVLEVVSQDRSVDELLSDVHIDRSPDASINSYLVRARNHAAKADYHAAIGEFKQALIIDKDNQTAKDGLAAAQAALLRLPGEIDQYARAGEWLDLSSGLLWTLKDSDHRVNWDGAVNYCQSLQTGGASNWRLPSIEELRAIQVPETDAGIKGGIALQDKGETIWSLSSDVTPYGPGAWVISFAKDSNSTGTVYPQYAIEYAICVRPYGGP